MADNLCVMCGEIIPEGRQVCQNCEEKNVGEFAKDTDVPGNTVRIIDRGGIGLYNGQLVTNPNRLTNADRIRAMSEDELAWFYAEKIASCYGCESSTIEDCYKCWLDWLKSPVEGIE